MDKLRRALSGDDRQPDEESGIMPQVKITLCNNTNSKSVAYLVQNQCCNVIFFVISVTRLNNTKLGNKNKRIHYLFCRRCVVFFSWNVLLIHAWGHGTICNILHIWQHYFHSKV